MNSSIITKDDALFFINMLKPPFNPNHVHGFYMNKSYYKILDDNTSDDFQRFIKVYNIERPVLKEREIQILDSLYGISKPRVTLKEASLMHNITQERVRQIQ